MGAIVISTTTNLGNTRAFAIVATTNPSQIKQTQAELERSQSTIKAMESSKFWNLQTAWFGLKRVIKQKNQIEQGPIMNNVDLRDQYISKVVTAKTFADVGGLWGTLNEKISVAHQHGAASLTMIDITPANGELWQKFNQRMSELGVRNYRSISKDICNLQIDDIGKPFDVVHCSGVLYHHPNPMLMLSALYNITRCNLILTSAITQEVIENEQGHYQIPPSGVLFAPALNDAERDVLKTYWEKIGAVSYGITEKVAFRLNDFGAWWWLPTASAMQAMCLAAGFKVLDCGLIWDDNAQTLLLGI